MDAESNVEMVQEIRDMEFVSLGCQELYCSYYRKRVKRSDSCMPVIKDKMDTCLYCNQSSEIITAREDEMIERGLGKEEFDKDGHRVVILVK